MPARDALHYQMIFMDDLMPGGILGRDDRRVRAAQRGMGCDGESPVDAVPNTIGMFAPTVPYDESVDGLRRSTSPGTWR